MKKKRAKKSMPAKAMPMKEQMPMMPSPLASPPKMPMKKRY